MAVMLSIGKKPIPGIESAIPPKAIINGFIIDFTIPLACFLFSEAPANNSIKKIKKEQQTEATTAKTTVKFRTLSIMSFKIANAIAKKKGISLKYKQEKIHATV